MTGKVERPSEPVENYHLLFNSIDQGFCVIEMIFDGRDHPVDYRFLEVNDAFEEQTGLSNAIGRRITELASGHDGHWLEIYGRIVRTGKPERFTNQARQLGRWFDVFAFPIGSPASSKVAVLFQDITGRKQAEELAANATTLLEQSMAQYRTLFTSMSQGFCVLEMLNDEDGLPRDLRVLEANPAFEEQVGLRGVAGKTASELDPNLARRWIDAYGGVLTTGEPIRLIEGSEEVGRWFDVHAFRVGEPGSYRVALLLTDITTTELAARELRASEEHFRRLADIAPVLIWLTDSENQGEYMNTEYTRFLDRPMEDLLGGGWQEFLHPEDAADYLQSFVAAANHRERFQREFRFLRKDGEYRWMRTVAVPRFKGPRYLGYAAVTSDVHADWQLNERQKESEAAERQARNRAELVNQVAINLETVESVEERAARLIEILVPAIADYASVEISGMEALVSTSEGEPEVRMVLPLGQGEGLLRLGFDPDRDLSPAELDLATEIAARAQLLLGNALLRREERQVVERLQQALLPDGMLVRPEAVVAAHYQAGSGQLEVGGDWYDSFELPSGRMGFVVGDVVGHGLEAAAGMGRMRVALAALAADADSPGELLTKVDRFARGPNGCDFATVFYAILDPDSGELRYASAGHPPALVVLPTGESRWLEGGRSIPLGVSNDSKRPDASTTLAPGSLVVFYSDGLIERRGEPLSLGLARLEQAARSHRHAFVDDLSRILVNELRLEGDHDDDTVVMCLRYLASVGPRFSRLFPARAGELSHLRAAIQEWQRDRGLSEYQQYRLLLAVGEACSNSVLHAYVGSEPGEVEVHIRQEADQLVVRVRDFGKWKHPSASLGGGGRGTEIMEKITEDFRRRTSETGTVVDFRVPIGLPS